MTFDEIRAAHPTLAVSLYAMTPGADVTLEVIAPDGETFSFIAATADDAIAKAFPPARDEPAPTPASAFE